MYTAIESNVWLFTTAVTVILTTQLLTFHAVDKVCLPTMYNVDSLT